MAQPTATQNLPLLRLVGVIFGAAFTLVGAVGVRDGLESRHWAWAPAKVISAERTGMGDHQSSRIVAEYRLPDYFVHCGQVAIGRENDPDDVDRYPTGSEITVHYDPANLNRCALEPGVSVGSLLFLTAGAAMFGLALWAHRRLRRDAAA